MTDEKPRVIIIPPKPELQQAAAVTKQLRVAAYCRVSTKEEEQASSYEAQCEYYTDKIMSNKEWTMAGIFADEGITGTSTKKRTEFLRMIRQCKQKKIDLILTKSIQRFARNTLDCINYTRILRQLGIGVLFEKENINSLPPDSEFMITMYGAMAQSESESISGNIRRGRQMHAKVGTLKVPCYRLYGYEKDTEGKFRVIPEQAEIVRELYKRYESGASLRNLQDWLEENQIKTVLGESKWTTTSIKSILTNEKYCGDVLLQKTFRTDVISKKVIKNVGQMAQYYMPDHHEAIVSREQYNAVKAEMARRSALRSPSKTAVTGRSCYTSKYALSDRLVCGECGTLYRRCTWTSRGRKYPVWRGTSRLNYGTKYCHDSPTIKEEPLQAAILAAINSAMSNKPALLDLIKNAVSLELLPVQGQSMSLADIERQKTTQRKNRGRLIRAALVGYTNVGKSTLINLLAKAEVFAENKLFATLDTTVRKVIIENLPFLLADTVGFIRKLPTDLVESFKSTLDEVREADLLIHVVDVSHPDFEEQVEVVNKTLCDLGCSDKPQIMVFNKVDAYTWVEKEADDLTPATRENLSLSQLKKTWMARLGDDCIFISARERQNIDELKELIYSRVRQLHVQKYPYNDFLFQQYDENGEAQ